MNKRRIFSLVVSCAIVFAAQHATAAVAEETIENSYSVPEKANITVRNVDGRIQVYGWEENEIRLTAFKRAFTKERLDAIEINVEIGDDSVLIDTVYPPPPQGSITADRSGTVEYVILVPQHATITKLDLANGELLVEGMRGGNVNAQVGNGKLHVRDCFAPTEVSLKKGIMDLLFNWWEDTGFSLRAELGDGNLRAVVPGTAAVRIDATSESGHVTNDFTKQNGEGPTEDGPTSKMLIGYESGSTFELRTTSGSIRIEKLY